MSDRTIIGPETVLAAYLRYPLALPDGRRLYAVEASSGFYSANEMPSVRDADGRPMELREEIAPGALVMLALEADGELCALKVVTAVWDDPFGG